MNSNRYAAQRLSSSPINLTGNALPIALEVLVTWTGRRLHVQVTSPKRTSGPRRYAGVSTPTCDLNRTGCSSGITCEMAIFRNLIRFDSFSMRSQLCIQSSESSTEPPIPICITRLRRNTTSTTLTERKTGIATRKLFPSITPHASTKLFSGVMRNC